MPAYVVIDLKVTDPQQFGQYAKEAAEVLAQFGGRNVLVDLKPTVLEGPWQPNGLVIQEFPDAATVDRWYRSPGYQRLTELRRQTSEATMVVGASE
ncbi:DUF1330 domain-containing protein [Symbioplanes lichenis]|uniref:DUF1330 domain-containing protein n=1 Tax=Symbioplanes lichenis TaxID=1629072 RepID=UPI00273817B3|nr:DUF1330 domain-containing protein [Actinoplanes lichenis]